MCRDKLSPLFPAKTWMDMCEKSQQHFCMQGTPDLHPQHSPPSSKHPSPEYVPLSEPARLRRGTAIYTKNETDSQCSSQRLCPRASQLPKNSYEESLRGEKTYTETWWKVPLGWWELGVVSRSVIIFNHVWVVLYSSFFKEHELCFHKKKLKCLHEKIERLYTATDSFYVFQYLPNLAASILWHRLFILDFIKYMNNIF